MIVEDPPYELVAVFADADAQRFVGRLIERGQERQCLRAFRWRSVRTPLRDTLVSRPETVLAPYRRLPGPKCRYLLLWDHQGCGLDPRSAEDIERRVREDLIRTGLPEDDLVAACIEPELEVLLGPVFDRVRSLLARKRGCEPPPDDDQILTKARWIEQRRPSSRVTVDSSATAMTTCPKEWFEALLSVLNLRRSPALFEELGDSLSIPDLKRVRAAALVASRLEEWFPFGIPGGGNDPRKTSTGCTRPTTLACSSSPPVSR